MLKDIAYWVLAFVVTVLILALGLLVVVLIGTVFRVLLTVIAVLVSLGTFCIVVACVREWLKG